MKPQDIFILLKIAAKGKLAWKHTDLAHELKMSQSEVSSSLERSKRAKLIDASKKKIRSSALLEFLIYGLKYVYPVEPGQVVRGIPTAHSAPPLKSMVKASSEDQYVWPHVDGKVKGHAIEPLYESVPLASQNDKELYMLLALVDALRVGRVREQEFAREYLVRKLSDAV